MEEITALDLLNAMVRQAPENKSIVMGEVLNGYLDAYNGRTGSREALGRSITYRKGYFACNQHPITIGERTSEILGLQSIMIDEGNIEAGLSTTLRVRKYCEGETLTGE